MLDLRARQSASQCQNKSYDGNQTTYYSKNVFGQSTPRMMSRDKIVKAVVKRIASSNHNTKNQTHDDSQNNPTPEISSDCPSKYHQRSFHIKSSIGLTKKAEPRRQTCQPRKRN